MSVQNWFPTSIYYDQLTKNDGERLNEELLKEAYQFRDMDDDGRAWSNEKYIGGYTSFASLAELNKISSTFAELENYLNHHVNLYAQELDFELGDGSLNMTDCWLNIMPAGTSHSMHIHPLSVISGTYYVKTPRNASGIKFEDPRLDKFMAAPPKAAKARKKNRQYATYKAKAGYVVLFESWLRHEVPASITDEDRISISFNYDWS